MIDGENGANVTQWRPRIEHAQIMTAQDLARTGRLGGVLFVSLIYLGSDLVSAWVSHYKRTTNACVSQPLSHSLASSSCLCC